MDSSNGAGKLQTTRGMLIWIAFALVPLVGHAQLQVSGSQSARFSDNALKTSTNETSDLESQTSITANYVSDPGRCNTAFSGSLSYSIWQDNSFDNETSAGMNLNSQCELATGLFWVLDNNLREVRQDVTQSDTPENRTRKNVFGTGPRYVWRLNSTNFVTFSTRYENTQYEEPENADSERTVSSVAWNHLFSDTLGGGVTSSYSDTELDTGAEVTVTTVNVTANKRWTTTQLSGALGMSEIETKDGATSQASDGVVGEIDLTRALNPSTNWYLRGARELTDRTSSFDIRFEEFEFNLQESIAVETTTVSTGINKRFSDRGSLNVNLFTTQSESLDTNQLEERSGLDVGFSQPMSSRVSGDVRFGYRYSRFEEDESDDQVINLDFGLSYLASRDLSLSGRLGHEKKTSDVRNREYDEFWALIGVEYRFR